MGLFKFNLARDHELEKTWVEVRPESEFFNLREAISQLSSRDSEIFNHIAVVVSPDDYVRLVRSVTADRYLHLDVTKRGEDLRYMGIKIIVDPNDGAK